MSHTIATKRNLESPNIFPHTLAYDAELNPSLRGIDVLADGTLFVEDAHGTETSYTFTGVVNPVRLVLQIGKIVGDGSGAVGNGTTGTDIALANLRGLI